MKGIIIASWCDAGQQNRPDRASGLAPQKKITGEECTVAIINWKSCKAPRQCLGSNGAEVQALTEAEEATFKLRAVSAELHGTILRKHTLYSQIRDLTCGVLIMDTRGIFDATTRNVSSVHGLRYSRAGYELPCQSSGLGRFEPFSGLRMDLPC